MLSFKHNFPKQGEELTADINYNRSKNSNENNIQLIIINFPATHLAKTLQQKKMGKVLIKILFSKLIILTRLMINQNLKWVPGYFQEN